MFKKLTFYVAAYFLISIILFYGIWLACPGFPFFPKTVYRSNAEEGSAQLKKGGYYILYFVSGERKTPINQNDIFSNIKLDVIPNDKTRRPIVIMPSHFYFDDAPHRSGTRGDSVGFFKLSTDMGIVIKSDFLKRGYDGIMIRTGFMRMLVSIAIYEVTVLIVSLILTRLILKLVAKGKSEPTRQP